MERKPQLKLSVFEWSKFVSGGSFEAALIGGLGAALGLIELDPTRLHSFIIYNPWLTFACFVIAFTRVWKSIREEKETSGLWDQFTGAETSAGKVCMSDTVDRFFEVPYVLTIIILPLCSLFWQGMAVCLIVFYICDNFYNRSFVENITAGPKAAAEPVQSDCRPYLLEVGRSLIASLFAGQAHNTGRFENSREFEQYFRKRFRLNQIALIATVIMLAIGTMLAWMDFDTNAVWVGLIHVAFLLGLEAIYEPHRNLGIPIECDTAEQDGQPEPVLTKVESAAALSAEQSRQLKQLHNGSFGPEERQYTAKFMREHTGRDGYQLHLVHCGDTFAGYIFFQIKRDRNVAYLWYMAVDPSMRNRGIGGIVVRKTLDIIRREAPNVRLVLLESHCPAPDEPASGVNRRRIEFYKRLGAHHITGINYGVPAANEPKNLVCYDILFFDFDGAATRESVRDAVAEMMRGNLKPDDARLAPMLDSLQNMQIKAPPSAGDEH